MTWSALAASFTSKDNIARILPSASWLVRTGIRTETGKTNANDVTMIIESFRKLGRGALLTSETDRQRP